MVVMAVSGVVFWHTAKGLNAFSHVKPSSKLDKTKFSDSSQISVEAVGAQTAEKNGGLEEEDVHNNKSLKGDKDKESVQDLYDAGEKAPYPLGLHQDKDRTGSAVTNRYREPDIDNIETDLATNYAPIFEAVGMRKKKSTLHQPKNDFDKERYYLKGEWFEPGQKYFVYQPSGGLSNQRLILEHALLAAKALGRVLVVPPVAPHTSMFWNYNKVEWSRTVEAFKIFEKSQMERAVPVLGLKNCIHRRFVEFNEKRKSQNWLRVLRDRKSPDIHPLTTSELQTLYGNSTANVLFFAQTTMWRGFNFTESEMAFARNHVQLNQSFRHVARLATAEMFPAGVPFSAVHIRFEDRYTQVISDTVRGPGVFLSRLNRHNASSFSKQLYIATQPSRIYSTYFETFRKAGFELTFSKDVLKSRTVLAFLDQFPKNDILVSILGLLEQLICARAVVFAGTGFSTFSFYIRVKRNNKLLAFDGNLLSTEVDPAVDDISAVVEALAQQDTVDSVREIEFLSRPGTCQEKLVSTKTC